MVVCWTGKPAEAKKAFAPFREAAPTVAEWVAEVGKLSPVDFGGETSAELVRAGRRELGLED